MQTIDDYLHLENKCKYNTFNVHKAYRRNSAASAITQRGHGLVEMKETG